MYDQNGDGLFHSFRNDKVKRKLIKHANRIYLINSLNIFVSIMFNMLLPDALKMRLPENSLFFKQIILSKNCLCIYKMSIVYFFQINLTIPQ